jgi:hypothetical protein
VLKKPGGYSSTKYSAGKDISVQNMEAESTFQYKIFGSRDITVPNIQSVRTFQSKIFIQ